MTRFIVVGLAEYPTPPLFSCKCSFFFDLGPYLGSIRTMKAPGFRGFVFGGSTSILASWVELIGKCMLLVGNGLGGFGA